MVEKKNLRIVYMGTPDFAVEALRCLVEGGYNVVGVITMRCSNYIHDCEDILRTLSTTPKSLH